MKKILKAFDCLIMNNVKFLIIKLFYFKRFSYKATNYISLMNKLDIQDKGQIILGRKLNIPSKSTLGVRENGILTIDDGVFINNNCQIISHKNIKIGKNVCIGPNTVIVDHNHQFGEEGVKKKNFTSKDIVIDDGVWIGANCVILKGTKIGKNSVIGAGSIVNCDIPENVIFIQEKQNKIIKIKKG